MVVQVCISGGVHLQDMKRVVVSVVQSVGAEDGVARRRAHARRKNGGAACALVFPI